MRYYKRRSPSSEADENGESDGNDESGESGEWGKKFPCVWWIFKFHAKRGPLESGDFDENREYDENIANRASSKEKVPNLAKIHQSLVENLK